MTISYNAQDISDENNDSHLFTVQLTNVDIRIRNALSSSISALVEVAQTTEALGWSVDAMRTRLNRLEKQQRGLR